MIEIVLREGTAMPIQMTPGAAGYDLCAAEGVAIPAGCIASVPTGVRLSIGDPRVVGLVFARSGLAKYGISLANGVGVIDSDYQGEIQVLLMNGTGSPNRITQGSRIAQLVFMPVLPDVRFVLVPQFSIATKRGDGGFGSTGV